MFRFSPQSAILLFMRLALIVSMLMTSLALNAQTIQGRVVRVSDSVRRIINYLRENDEVAPLWSSLTRSTMREKDTMWSP